MPKRILKYQIAIIEMAMKNRKRMKKEEKLPLVIPIVIYTGERKWNVAKNIKDCQEQLEGLNNIELGSYIVLDSNDYTKQELLKDELFILKIMALEKTKSPEELYNNLEEVIKGKIEKLNVDILLRITKHIYIEILGEEKSNEIIDKLKKESDEEMIIEVLKKDREQQWQKGKLEGRLEGERIGKKRGEKIGEKRGEKRGEKIGIAKAIKQMVKEMIKKQMSDDEIMEITKIDKEELERIKIA